MFGIVLIGSIYFSEYTCLLLLLVILMTGIYEYHGLVRHMGIEPQPLLMTVLNLFCFIACIVVPVAWQAEGITLPDLFWSGSIFIGLLLALMLTEIFRAKPRPLENMAAALFSVFYLALPLGLLLNASIGPDGAYNWKQVLFFFLFMWASDTGAYFTGKAFGKHKLLERLSPRKTIEGFFGGMILSIVTGWAAFHFIGQHPLLLWLAGGALMAFTGTLGDLFESMLKRQAGIKDSGNILPGHGGILDRFDSTFFSAPVYFLLTHVF